MRRTWTRWAGLFEEREAGTSLALFRMGVGGAVLIALGTVLADGALAPLWLGPAHGGYAQPAGGWLFTLLGGTTPHVVRAVVGGCLGLGVLLVLGLGGRLTALCTLLTYSAVVGLNGAAGGSYDPLMTNALWLLVLADATRTLSLDCRLATGNWTSEATVAKWPRWLVIVQLVLMYGSTALQKVSDTWMPGGGFSALYFILQQPTWQRFDMAWVAWIYPLTQAMTAVTWLFELSAPLLLLVLWYRRTAERPGRLRALANRLPLRGAFMAVGLTLHASVAALMVLGPFSWLVMSFYLCLVRPEEWARLLSTRLK